jgi:hypothetical protein
MTQITIFLDNSANSPENNSPGYSLWVGGKGHGDPEGIKVQKTDTNLSYTLDNTTSYLLTWYYNFGWYSSSNLNGPFTNGQIIKLDKVN